MLEIRCKRCGTYVFHQDFLEDTNYEFEDRHLVSGYTREKHELSEYITVSNLDWCKQVADSAPQSVPEKADNFLEALKRRTSFFGQQIELLYEGDYSLAYAKNATEFGALINYIRESGYIIDTPGYGRSSASHVSFSLGAKGLEALRSSSSRSLTVFISSTCYDLLDLRFELADFLESQGHVVRMSDDPNRFDIVPKDESIAMCKQNVASSDVVICILDRRYGGILQNEPYVGFSATEVEIQYARELQKPVYTFIRDQAKLEYDQLRHNDQAETPWVEKKRRKEWLAFAKSLIEMPDTPGRSNWIIPFKSSVDLKKLVPKPLDDFHRQRSQRRGN